MQADETKLKGLLEGERQYAVPYFQRSYSWGREQWNTLWDDVLEVYQSGAPHFLGSIVLLREGEDAPFLIIDGQQRLVTLCLLLAAIRGRGELKVLTTYRDREAFEAVMAGREELPFSPITEVYRLFRSSVEGLDQGRLERVVLSQLSFVAITLGEEDNPYRIFESLNAKGMPLTQGDLLRNYFFMRLPREEHDGWYRDVWTPMQTLLAERFDDFMRDALVKDGEFIRPDEVYQAWRTRLSPLSVHEVGEVLKDLREWSSDYDRVLHPQREPDAVLRKRLERLTAWTEAVTPSFRPFLLRVYADYARGRLDHLATVLAAVESFLVRRLFVSPGPSDDNRLFIELYGSGGFLEALSQPQHGWPDDEEFREAVVRCPLFFRSHPDQRKLVLEALEESLHGASASGGPSPARTGGSARAPFERLEIEFIAPLLARPDWLTELGGGEDLHWRLVGTLGNLAWGVRGRSLSLTPPERKRELSELTRYGLELNRGIAPGAPWSAAAIERRSRELAARAIGVWPGPRR